MVHGSPITADRNGRCEIGHGKVNPSGLVFWFGGFVATNGNYKREIFAARLPGILAPRDRETRRLAEILGAVGDAWGGNPGARLLKQLGMPGSPDTVLHVVPLGRPKKRATCPLRA